MVGNYTSMDKRCPKQLKSIPNSNCDMGENAAKNLGDKADQCPWFVNNEESYYCVWKWLSNRNNDGATKSELAQLLNSNISSINICENKTLQKFIERFKRMFPEQLKTLQKSFTRK